MRPAGSLEDAWGALAQGQERAPDRRRRAEAGSGWRFATILCPAAREKSGTVSCCIMTAGRGLPLAIWPTRPVSSTIAPPWCPWTSNAGRSRV